MAANDTWPVWSPNGRRIAFQADARPSWAHNGQIAFMGMRDGNMEIYVTNADGTNPTRITNSPTSDDYPFIK